MFYILSAILGLLIGSFLNCLAWRLYKNESISGRSYCPKCSAMIAWYDNIPLLSFLFLRGRCRHCRKKISWQYPLVEAATAMLFALAVVRIAGLYGSFEIWGIDAWITLLRDWILIASVIVVFITDARWYLIFFEVTIPSAVLVLLCNAFLGAPWQSLLLSATIGSGFFLLQYIVSKGRWIGEGDIWMGLLLGAAFSWPLILPAIFIAYLLGALVGIILIGVGKKQWSAMLPFGTFLAISSIITLFYGEIIVRWYMHLIGLN